MPSTIDICREFLGSAPRNFTTADWRGGLRMPPPRWLKRMRKDELWEIYHHRKELLQHGRVVWACVVQANEVLFGPGKFDAPAMAIYSPDAYFDDHLEDLLHLGTRLFALKGTQLQDPEEQRFAEIISNERERAMRLRVPDAMTDGHAVISTSIMVHRRHLPDGILVKRMVPLLIHPNTTPATIILPSRYWPPALLYAWRR